MHILHTNQKMANGYLRSTTDNKTPESMNAKILSLSPPLLLRKKRRLDEASVEQEDDRTYLVSPAPLPFSLSLPNDFDQHLGEQDKESIPFLSLKPRMRTTLSPEFLCTPSFFSFRNAETSSNRIQPLYLSFDPEKSVVEPASPLKKRRRLSLNTAAPNAVLLMTPNFAECA